MFFPSYLCYFLKIIFFCSFLWPFEGFFISAECNDLYPTPQIVKPPIRHQETLILMIMGEERKFKQWESLILQSKYKKNIDFVYASYDKRIVCSINCAMFIPNTTWTEGRNLLAAHALQKEKTRGQPYEWWGFSDDDCIFLCNPKTEYQVLCFDKLVEKMMLPDGVPNRAVGIGLVAKWPHPNDYRSVSSVDAIFNVYRRSFIPFVMPYVDLAAKESQWHSQLMMFHIISGCAKSSIYIPEDVFYINPDHREYDRGLNGQIMDKTIRRNFPGISQFLIDANPGHNANHKKDMIASVTKQALSAAIPCRREIKCLNLTRRFQAWRIKNKDWEGFLN